VVSEVAQRGAAAELWRQVSENRPSIRPDAVTLRARWRDWQHDFDIAWDWEGSHLMVSVSGELGTQRMKLLRAAKMVAPSGLDFSGVQNFRRDCVDVVDGRSGEVLIGGAQARPIKAAKAMSSGHAEDLGQGARAWQYLVGICPDLAKSHVRLRIQFPDGRHHDFDVAWDWVGAELMVLHDGKRQKVGAAARAVLGQLPDRGKIAYNFGSFMHCSQQDAEPVKMATYSEVYCASRAQASSPPSQPQEEGFSDPAVLAYLTTHTPPVASKIAANIISRRRLWEAFLERKRMTKRDFQRLAVFKPKGISGFADKWLVYRRIARRDGDTYVLNEAAAPEIRRLLDADQRPGAFDDPGALTYFADITAMKAKRIRENIIERAPLWEAFLERKQMTQQDFKGLATFKPKGINGFADKYLVYHRFARRDGYIYTLNEAVIPEIRRLLGQVR